MFCLKNPFLVASGSSQSVVKENSASTGPSDQVEYRRNLSSRVTECVIPDANMNSDGYSSGSDSELSQVSDWSLNSDITITRPYPRRVRRESVTSVCTQPEEDAYVMVLQNKLDLYNDLKHASASELSDVTFSVGDDRKSVHGIRAVITARSRLLGDLIQSHEKGTLIAQSPKPSPLRKTLSKLKNLTPKSSDKRRNKSLVIPMKTFDARSFQRLMTYIHSGTLTVDASTVIGLLNAAYMFGLPEVCQACWDFALGCVVRADNLQDVLESAQRYADHKMTTRLIKTIRLFIDDYPALLSQSPTLAALAEEVFRQHCVPPYDIDHGIVP